MMVKIVIIRDDLLVAKVAAIVCQTLVETELAMRASEQNTSFTRAFFVHEILGYDFDWLKKFFNINPLTTAAPYMVQPK